MTALAHRVIVGLMALLLVAFMPLAAQTQLIVVYALSWSSDGISIAVAYQDGRIEIVNTVTGEAYILRQVQDESPTNVITAMEWSPSNSQLLLIGITNVGNPRGTVELISTDENRTLLTLAAGETVRDITWSSDGTKFAAALNPFTNMSVVVASHAIRIWDANTGEVLNSISSPATRNNFTSLDWSINDQIAVSMTDGIIYTANYNAHEWTQSLEGHTGNVDSVMWSPLGDRLASVSFMGDSTARIWDVQNGDELFTRETRFAIDIAWSPDGRQIAIGQSQAVIVIDSSSNQIIAEYITGALERAVNFSPFGGRLAFGGEPSTDVAQEAQALSGNLGQTISGGAVQIVVPNPSLERLEAIAAACNAPLSLMQPLAAQTDALSDEAVPAAALDAFVAQLDALPTDTIPPGCAADLRAVAEAIEANLE